MINLSSLEQKIGIKFKNKKFIQQAFVHRSYLNESKKIPSSNERLEFLGDSILSFLVSEHLYKRLPNFPEGELTNLRSALVNTTTLAQTAKVLDLGTFLMFSKGEEEGGGRQNIHILADTFEALLGAIYLDQGIGSVKKVLEKLLFPLVDKILIEKTYKDAKSTFQEVVQEKTKISPVYKVLKEIGPDHAKDFTVGVYVGNMLFGKGVGKSKQEAEMKAAAAALEEWRKKR